MFITAERIHLVMKQVDTSGLSFQDIREDGKYYVDKTLLLKDMLDTNDRGVYLYTRPRRFGKTTNITMLDAFFNIEYKGNTWFDGLAISEFPEYERYRNAFPVVYIDLKDVTATSYDQFLEAMGATISMTLARFINVLRSDVVLEHESDRFNRIFRNEASEIDLRMSIRTLSDLLERYYSRKVIVLIDEYDRAVTDSFGSEIQERIMKFLGEFFSATFKSNGSLQMAYITGVMQVARAGMFSGLNNITINNVASTTSDERFGFTESEVRGILDYFGHPERFEEVREWYDGYRFGDAEVYNPFSVMLYVQNGFVAKGYWAGTSRNLPLNWMVGRADSRSIDTVSRLIAGETAETDLHFEITYEDLIHLRERDLYSLMVMTGYLKSVSTEGGYLVSIPNKEVMEDLDTIMSNNSPQVNDRLFLKFCRAMLEGMAADMEPLLNDILAGGNYLNLNKEYAYELVLMTMTRGIIRNYDVRTERQEGNGRTDMILTPKTDGYPPIVIELKTTDRIDGLDAAVRDALHQIHDRRYYNGMSGKVILYGIAFCGVVAKVGTETLDL